MLFKRWCTLVLCLMVCSVSPVSRSAPTGSQIHAVPSYTEISEKAVIYSEKSPDYDSETWTRIDAVRGGIPDLFTGTQNALFMQTHLGRLHFYTGEGAWLTAQNHPVSLPMISIAEVTDTGEFFASVKNGDDRLYSSLDKVVWSETGIISTDNSIILCEHKGTVWAAVEWSVDPHAARLLRYDPLTNRWDAVNTINTIFEPGRSPISNIASNGDTLVLMDVSGSIIYTNDEGMSWHKATNAPSLGSGVEPMLKGAGSLFFYYGYTPPGDSKWQEVFVSDDGSNWKLVLRVALDDVVVDVSADDNGTAYVARSKTGVYKSTKSLLNDFPDSDASDSVGDTWLWQAINENLPDGTRKLAMFRGNLWAASFEGKLSIYDEYHDLWNYSTHFHDVDVKAVAQSDDSVYLALSSTQIYKGTRDGNWSYLTYPLGVDREIIFDFGVQGNLMFLLNNRVTEEGRIKDVLHFSTDGGVSRRPVVLPDKPYAKVMIRKYGDHFVMGTYYGIFYCDSDDFQTWVLSKLVGKLADQDMTQVRVYYFLAVGEWVVAASSMGMLVSKDHGLSWDSYNDGLEGAAYAGQLSYTNDTLYFAASPYLQSTQSVMLQRQLSEPNATWTDISKGLVYSKEVNTYVVAASQSYYAAFASQYEVYLGKAQYYGALYGLHQGSWTNQTSAGLPSSRPTYVLILGNRLIVPTLDSGVYSAPLLKPGQ